jgi:hypothetical protein
MSKEIDLFSGKEIVQNGDEKYSELILELMDIFKKYYPDEMELQDKIQFTCDLWNLGCMSQKMNKTQFENLMEVNGFPEEENLLVRKLLKLKRDKYSDYELFISHFEFEEKNNKPVLSVFTYTHEDYIASLLDEYDEFDEEPDFEDGYINRFAIIIKAKKPFIDWINSIYPENKDSFEMKEANVYLVDAAVEDIEKWLKMNYSDFFDMELEDWYADEKDWPKKRNYKMFRQWFQVDVSSMVYDTVREPIYKG